jgi:hypothetical protein
LTQRERREGAWATAAIAACVVFAAPAWSLIGAGFVKGRGAFDQLNYHEQVVRTFAEQLPRPDYSNYLSATTPGYHTLLALLARAGVEERWMLQAAGSAFALALLGLLAWGVGRAPGVRIAERGWERTALVFALVFPLATSMPVFYSGTWMLPDNAGWLGVLVIWLIALRPGFGMGSVVAGGAALAALVFFRQIHLWPLAMLLTWAWMSRVRDPDAEFGAPEEARALLADVPGSLGRAALVLAASIPALAVLWWFWRTWGGLTPPVFLERHVGINPVAPAFVLAVFGGCSLFFVPYLTGALGRLWTRQPWVLVVAVVVGLAFGLAFPTTRSYIEGRYSGLWEVAEKMPAPGGRSLLVVPLAVVGAVLMAAWFTALGRRDRWIMLAAMVAFVAAQCVSHKLWQRYTEPLVVMWLALAAARVRPGPGVSGWRVLGPVSLGLCLGALTAASLVAARPVHPRALVAPWETRAPELPGMAPRVREGPDRRDGGSDPGR